MLNIKKMSIDLSDIACAGLVKRGDVLRPCRNRALPQSHYCQQHMKSVFPDLESQFTELVEATHLNGIVQSQSIKDAQTAATSMLYTQLLEKQEADKVRQLEQVAWNKILSDSASTMRTRAPKPTLSFEQFQQAEALSAESRKQRLSNIQNVWEPQNTALLENLMDKVKKASVTEPTENPSGLAALQKVLDDRRTAKENAEKEERKALKEQDRIRREKLQEQQKVIQATAQKRNTQVDKAFENCIEGVKRLLAAEGELNSLSQLRKDSTRELAKLGTKVITEPKYKNLFDKLKEAMSMLPTLSGKKELSYNLVPADWKQVTLQEQCVALQVDMKRLLHNYYTLLALCSSAPLALNYIEGVRGNVRVYIRLNNEQHQKQAEEYRLRKQTATENKQVIEEFKIAEPVKMEEDEAHLASSGSELLEARSLSFTEEGLKTVCGLFNETVFVDTHYKYHLLKNKNTNVSRESLGKCLWQQKFEDTIADSVIFVKNRYPDMIFDTSGTACQPYKRLIEAKRFDEEQNASQAKACVVQKEAMGRTTVEGFGPFNSVFPTTFSNKYVYRQDPDRPDIVPLSGMLSLVQEGYSNMIFGYGYSGSGKTFTFFGDKATKTKPAVDGILQLAIADYLLSGTVFVYSAFELYGQIHFAPYGADYVHKIKQDIYLYAGVSLPTMSTTQVHLFDTREQKAKEENSPLAITNVSQVQDLLDDIQKKRIAAGRIKSTPNNKESSRGHLFLIFQVKSAGVLGLTNKTGYLTVVDMAGVESPFDIGAQYVDVTDPAKTSNVRKLIFGLDTLDTLVVDPLNSRQVQTSTVIRNNRLRSGNMDGVFDDSALLFTIVNGFKYRNRVGPDDLQRTLKKQDKERDEATRQGQTPPVFPADWKNTAIIQNWVKQLLKEGFYINETVNHLRYYFANSLRKRRPSLVLNGRLSSGATWQGNASKYDKMKCFTQPNECPTPPKGTTCEIALIGLIDDIRSLSQGILTPEEKDFNDLMTHIGAPAIEKTIIAMLCLCRTDFLTPDIPKKDAPSVAERYVLRAQDANRRLDDVSTTLRYASEFYPLPEGS
jgi:hypothetical protein